jgi:GH25 family lysozyme M1 (1,4-beta-N-acetylmuramidase)
MRRRLSIRWRPAAAQARAAAAGCGVLAVLAAGQPGISPAAAAAVVPGLDVSDHQHKINWRAVRSDGAQFAYVKATEGISFVSPGFASEYQGAHAAGLIRGAYHFALPGRSSGAAQARFSVAHGGGWTADSRTLPGALDMEWNPYGAECYRLSRPAMVAWIASFVNSYHALTRRWPVIYTVRRWWSQCTGGYGGFAARDPLWGAGYADGRRALPAGWRSYAFWQYAAAGTFPGDQDIFAGPRSRLRRLAASG